MVSNYLSISLLGTVMYIDTYTHALFLFHSFSLFSLSLVPDAMILNER
jgi:hypothetical protein